MARNYSQLVEELRFHYYPAPSPRYEARVLLVHFFGGSQRLLKRHIRLLHQLGLHVYAFDFSYRRPWIYKCWPGLRSRAFEIRRIWYQELQEVLAYGPGPVLLFSFSGPAAISVQAAANDQGKKICGLISDSGPFTHILHCNYNLAKAEFGLQRPWQKAVASLVMSPLWGLGHSRDLRKNLARIRPGTPYLSLQPELDEVVPVSYMRDSFLSSDHRLALTEISFPHSGHLNALKNEAEAYRKALQNWLTQHFDIHH